jgi:hypothetical protein
MTARLSWNPIHALAQGQRRHPSLLARRQSAALRAKTADATCGPVNGELDSSRRRTEPPLRTPVARCVGEVRDLDRGLIAGDRLRAHCASPTRRSSECDLVLSLFCA